MEDSCLKFFCDHKEQKHRIQDSPQYEVTGKILEWFISITKTGKPDHQKLSSQ